MSTRVVVYEKRTCTTCRKLAELLRERGIDYDAVDYHVFGLTEDEVGLSAAVLTVVLFTAWFTTKMILRPFEPGSRGPGGVTST